MHPAMALAAHFATSPKPTYLNAWQSALASWSPHARIVGCAIAGAVIGLWFIGHRRTRSR